MEVEKGYHCAYQIHYHIVFPVKYRKGLLRGDVVKVIKEVAAGLEERYGMVIERLGCDGNHIHLLCGAHPKYAPGQLVRLFKSIVVRELFAKIRGLRREMWGGEFWSDGYYVATVGERGNWEVVEKYVRLQGRKEDENQLRLF